MLEHLVDCVLQFEGERERTYRTLRALKNRFGSTSEAGVFEMRQDGLVEVLDASARFVGEATRAPGSVVLAAMEGSRPLLVEVQALVSESDLEIPRRVVTGIDRNRLALVLAVLARHGGVGVGSSDVFVNVVGGVRVDEPGADLAVALAVASAARGITLTVDPIPPTRAARIRRRWPASASWASPASCAASPTRTVASRRRASSAWRRSSRRKPARCGQRCDRARARTSAPAPGRSGLNAPFRRLRAVRRPSLRKPCAATENHRKTR